MSITGHYCQCCYLILYTDVPHGRSMCPVIKKIDIPISHQPCSCNWLSHSPCVLLQPSIGPRWGVLISMQWFLLITSLLWKCKICKLRQITEIPPTIMANIFSALQNVLSTAVYNLTFVSLGKVFWTLLQVGFSMQIPFGFMCYLQEHTEIWQWKEKPPSKTCIKKISVSQ